MELTGLLKAVQNLLAPITVGWLSLPKEAATAFVMGIVRRDFGAAGLTELTLDPLCNCCFFNYHNLICPLYSCHFSNF